MQQPREITITLNHIPYSYQQIITGNYAVPQTEFETHILAFCKAWLQGASRFTLNTSGSTGPPKPITLTREQMIASARKIGQKLQLKARNTALVCLDSRYIAGQMMLVRSFVWDMNVYAITPSSNPFDSIPENIPIDIASLVPYQLRHILHSTSHKRLHNIKCILVGGGSISDEIKKELAKLPCNVYATYGMTETAAAIALQPLNGSHATDYFHALPGITIDQNRHGCLVIETDYLDGKIVTHDLVSMVSNNQFQWLGRKDNIINSGGVKVVPEHLERTIGQIFEELQLPNRFFIAGLPHPHLGQKVCLMVEGNAFTPAIMGEVTQRIEAAASTYTMPKEVHFIAHFVTTPSGKADRIKTTCRITQKST